MAVQKTDMKEIIDCSLKLFRRQGYHRTTMAEIGIACGLLKGSLYHYFPSKEALAQAVMDDVHSRFSRAIFQWADDLTLDADARLERMMRETESYFLNGDGGCVMGNLALEVIDTIPEFGQKIRNYFKDWSTAISYILSCRLDHNTAQERADRAVAEIQGAIMMMRIYGNRDALTLTTQGILDDFRK